MKLLHEQVISFENIKTLCTNYKKDSITRKTQSYLEDRLEKLEDAWVEFHERHEELVQTITDQTNVDYFRGSVYEKTKEMYEVTKRNISDLLIQQREQKEKRIEFDLTNIIEEQNDDKILELMNTQECNFRALSRAMSKVDVEFISEMWEIQRHLSTLTSKWETIDGLHWKLEGVLKGSPTLNKYYHTFENIEKKYDNIIRSLNQKLNTNIHYQRSAPQIDIPIFSGDYMQWASFKDQFTDIIHNNPTLTSCQKMQHLKTKLRGEAERLVQHLTINGDNYFSCWDILTRRYDNRRLQFTTIMNIMNELPVIQTPNKYNLKKMHDVIVECLNALTNMGVEVSTWDPIVVYYMSQKLDSSTYDEYSKEMKNKRDIPDLQEFLSFLENKFVDLQANRKGQRDLINSASQKQFNKNFQNYGNKNSHYKNNFKNYNPNRNHAQKSISFERNKDLPKTFHAKSYGKCPLCNEDHVLMQCDTFVAMNPKERNNITAKLDVCKNCLYSHGNANCKSIKTCKECNLKHHSLLHSYSYEPTAKKGGKDSNFNSTTSEPSTSKQKSLISHYTSTDNVEILLTTVKVQIQAGNGTYITLRALLDQGSQVNLITENAAQRLRLIRSKLNATVSGVGSGHKDCRGLVKLTGRSIYSDYLFNSEALVLKQITNKLPTNTMMRTNWPHIATLELADPEYYVSSSIDLLLGADIYAEILLEGVRKGDAHSPIAQKTQLGWILCGKMKTFNCHVTVADLNDLSRYWETEDITHGPTDIDKNDQCELYYQDSTKRTSDGKYIVKMPMITNFEQQLGKSRPAAISQYLKLENRLEKNEILSNMYKNFIQEYCDLQHMKPACHITKNEVSECFLPHHGVIRESSSTTKLRVVFNASQKTTSEKSLNCLMEKGPNLQKDIQELILKWRTYKYAFTADIEKMYRCIWIAEEQHHLQKIIWRNSPTEHLQEYALCTVTYGTKCAPWLAMRTLQQLAIDDGHKYPAAAKILQNEFYVDDLICGHNSLETAKHIQNELIKLLNGGGMNLRKWSCNNTKLLEQLHADQISSSTYDFKSEDSMKTLGLGWNPNLDTFTFTWDLKENDKKPLTKRTLLSQISKLYDPLGWFSPVTITAKLMFQEVWTQNLDWDQQVPANIQEHWCKLKAELPLLKTVKINRWIGSTTNKIDLMGFCDASEKAYSCIIFTRTMDDVTGLPILTLLTAKTRVAPLAQKLSLPRLELCGALLLAQLITKVKNALKEHNLTTWAWSDSKVVLAWIQGKETKWERYVENRVIKIRDSIPERQWNYVNSKNNPADCATRGLYPNKLLNYKLWWEGPELLKTFNDELKEISNCLFTTNIDKKQDLTTLEQTDNNLINKLINKYSSWSRAIRVLAWILRFIAKTRTKNDTVMQLPNYLTITEMNEAKNMFVKYTQRCDFKTEYNLLLKNETLTQKSVLYKLNTYLDKEGIMRVGGRLNRTNLPTGMKNPIILPRSGKITQLLIEEAHHATLHGGARLTLAFIRQRYWIVGGNRAVKTQLRCCVRCHRFKTNDNYQLMADLPAQRVTPSRPFTHTGVDFTGHVDVKLNKGRGVRTSKGYIAIFVCMATKAVHIELVSDLSTETFMAAFQRMCGRRGTPNHIYSDCGTNFIGASKLLRNEYELFRQELPSEFFDKLTKMEVEWHFNAPSWPTAGGLWEASVRSMKYHLRRILGDQKLTFEEFTTLLTKIEACMNSRPLCPLTEDPEEFENYLTPGHFLTGSPTTTLPLSSYLDEHSIDLRQRWQLTEHMFHRFWKLWSSDYLTQLQARSKWQKSTLNLKNDDIVLVKDNNLPPGKWAMGRVIEVHPGSDGHVRVVSIKTQTNIIKRPITKLSPLPINQPKSEHNQLTMKTTPSAVPSAAASKRVSKTSALTFLTLLFLCVGSGTGTPNVTKGAQITTLGDNRPLYYDEIGDIQLIHDEWRLLMYFNLTTYWDGVDKIEAFINELQIVCKKIHPKYCETTMQQLYHELELLKHYNELLLVPHKHLSGRSKRGLIDGVGYVANSLFGILDQRFAEKYEKDIKCIQQNENHLLELTKNQTSIIELQNDILTKSERNMKKQFMRLNKYTNETDMRIARVESEVEIVMATSYFTATSLSAHLLLNNIRNFQEMLYNAIIDVYQGHIDVHLLTPVNLIKQLMEISGKLPKTLNLPIENIQTDIKNIFKLIYARARVTNDYFLLEAHIPLTDNDDYTMYRIIPLPLKSLTNKNVMLSAQVSSKFIAVNFRKNTFVTMDNDDMKRCVERSSRHFVCNSNLPVQSLEKTSIPCEAKLLSHQDITSPCFMKGTRCESKWIELHASNSWLTFCCDSCTIRTVCSDVIQTHLLNTSSIVTLKQGCLLQSKDLMIHSRNNYNSDVNLSYDFQIPSLNNTINALVSTQRSMRLEITDNEKELTLVKKQLEQLKEEETISTPVTIHDVHQYVICYTLLSAAALGLVLWMARKRGWCTRRANVNINTELKTGQPTRKLRRSQSERGAPRVPVAALRAAVDHSPRATPSHPAEIKFDFK